MRLLFAFGSIASLRLQLILARDLARRGRTVAFLYWDARNAVFEQARVEAGSVGEVSALEDFDSADCPPGWQPRLRPKLLRIGASHPTIAAGLQTFRALHRTGLFRAEAALRSLRPAALIVSEDGISSNLHVIAAARNLRIPIVDVPYGYGVRDDLDRDLEIKERAGEVIRLAGLEGRLIRTLAPQWVKTGLFAGALMFPQRYILAAEYYGVTLRDAWIIHGGLADRLCAESDVAMARYLGEGVPRRKLTLTGSPYCDEMVAAAAGDARARNSIRMPTRIEPDRLRVLVSWPPSYHESRGHLNEFPSYEAMTRTIFEFLRDLPRIRLTVSLHPAASADTATLLASLGIDVSTEFVVGQIPLHDVFMTYYSSTIRWAIAAGKPVINYDAYRVELDVFDDAPGFVTVTGFAELKEALTALFHSDERFERLAAAQCAVAADWGLVDGLCSERIDQVITARVSHADRQRS